MDKFVHQHLPVGWIVYNSPERARNLARKIGGDTPPDLPRAGSIRSVYSGTHPDAVSFGARDCWIGLPGLQGPRQLPRCSSGRRPPLGQG